MTKLSFSSSVIVVKDIWLGLVSFESSEMRKGLSRSLSSKKNGVDSLWFRLSELIEGHAFTSSFDDFGSGRFAEFKSTDSEFWKSHHSFIVKNVAYNDQDFGFLLFSVGDFN